MIGEIGQFKTNLDRLKTVFGQVWAFETEFRRNLDGKKLGTIQPEIKKIGPEIEIFGIFGKFEKNFDRFGFQINLDRFERTWTDFRQN